MVFPVEQAHFCRTAIPLYGAEHGKALGHVAAVVLVRVDKENRRFTIFRKLKRGLLPEQIQVVSRISAQIHQNKRVADVGAVLVGDPVADGSLGRGSRKPVRMADDPVCHVSAVGAACHADTRFINLRIPL